MGDTLQIKPGAGHSTAVAGELRASSLKLASLDGDVASILKAQAAELAELRAEVNAMKAKRYVIYLSTNQISVIHCIRI